MASVSTPTVDEVLVEAGLKEYVSNDNTLRVRVSGLITDAQDACALAITESTYDLTTHTTRVARQIERAVKLRAAVLVLKSPFVRAAVGTPLPLLQNAELLGQVMTDLQAEAEEIEARVQTGSNTVPFARPAVSSSTYSRTSSDRLPSERNSLLSEADDIAADDTENG